MKVEKTQWLDVRDLLRGINGGCALLMLLAYPMFQNARYVDGLTLLLGIALALQVHWGLSKRMPLVDSLVVVFLYYVTTYYTLRVVTLAVFDMSDVFRRFPYEPHDTNYALAFIVTCNACVLSGFGFIRKQPSLPYQTLLGLGDICKVEVLLRPLLLVLLLSVIGSVTGSFDWLSSEFRPLRILIFFLRPTNLFLLLGVYFVVFHREISKRFFVAYISLLLIMVLDLLVQGSRGQIVYCIEVFMLILIANESMSICRKRLFRGLILVPMLLLTLIVSYNFATLQRSSNDKENVQQLAVTVDNLYGAISNGDGLYDSNNFSHILSRVGYLDISAEVIAHKQQYSPIFSGSYYAKSFVDNVLTPGWDIYDTPKIAYSLIFKHQGLNNGNPSKSYLQENNIYHSDQLGIYGEMYALFGWYSLPLLFLFACSLKCAYYNLWVSKDRYEEVLKRFGVLVFFVNCINSFGVDWIIVQMLPFILTSVFLIIYLRKTVSTTYEASV